MPARGKTRPKVGERVIRFEKLVRFTCDYLEGKYILPTGKTSKPGTLNKAELLRAAEYPATYKNAYMIFDKENFKAALVTEQARRRDIDVSLPDVRLDDEGDDELLERLVNRELLYRLRYNPGSIDTDTLLRARALVAKVKPRTPGEVVEGATRRLPDVKNLIIMLNGKIPDEALAMLPQGEVIDAEAIED